MIVCDIIGGRQAVESSGVEEGSGIVGGSGANERVVRITVSHRPCRRKERSVSLMIAKNFEVGR